MNHGRLIVISNRLPVTVERNDGAMTVNPSNGGLVSAMLPVLRHSGGTWLGWAGTGADCDIDRLLQQNGPPNCRLEAVYLSSEEKARFYDGCCNQIVWPLFHDQPSRCEFDPAYWEAYESVNEKFADAVENISRRGDFLWVHDYQLMLLADCLRARGVRHRTAYFHHIPFPHPDILEKMPWRRALLQGLLHFDLLGFQTVRDRRNFVASVRRCLPGARLHAEDNRQVVRCGPLSAEIGTFPISVDYAALSAAASTAEIATGAERIRRDLGDSRVVLGVDRLDYTKGILERLQAFETLLAFHPALRERVTLVQVVVPSREEIPEYVELKLAIERRVSHINGQHSTARWVPVHYLYRSVERQDLLAFYRAAHVALVTPLKDGMNLVAKEFCAARSDEQGVLVLSEFAGAAAELSRGALIVHPYDTDGIAEALERGLRMSEEEQRLRMRAMRSQVRDADVYHWARRFCARASLAMPAGSLAAAGLPLGLLAQSDAARAAGAWG